MINIYLGIPNRHYAYSTFVQEVRIFYVNYLNLNKGQLNEKN